MVEDGVPLYEVAKILGHGSVYVTERYSPLVPGPTQVPIDRLGARLRPEDLPLPSDRPAPAARGRKPKSPPDSAAASAVAS